LSIEEHHVKNALYLLAAVILSSSVAEAGEPCVGLVELQRYLHAAQSNAGAPSVACGSLSLVIARLINGSRKSGRRLEDDQPLNVPDAQSNLNSALRDAGIRRRIEQMRREVTEENMRLAYEAAILDEEGYYMARDLRIMQLADRVK
jgi:hypothetical protein